MRKAIVLAAALAWASSSFGQTALPDTTEVLKKVSESCQEQARVLTDARFSKWRKTRPDQVQKLPPEAYQTVRKVMHTQCVSVHHVVILQILKSTIPSEEAVRLDIDGQIAKLMDVIERSL